MSTAQPLRICLTGGPCAGKTSVTELVKRHFAKELEIINESASILYRGGFPRAHTDCEMKQAQTAIFHVQRAAENFASASFAQKAKMGLRGFLCDRGTVDGAAYWPTAASSTDSFFTQLATTVEAEHARYDYVIHMESATETTGYSAENGIRTETPVEALALDRRIQEAWQDHPNLVVVTSRHSFLEKVDEVVQIIKRILGSF